MFVSDSLSMLSRPHGLVVHTSLVSRRLFWRNLPESLRAIAWELSMKTSICRKEVFRKELGSYFLSHLTPEVRLTVIFQPGFIHR